MINETFVGEVCHIEAKAPGGARYNANMTQEEREDYDNLILLCPTHHTLIDKNEKKFTVDVLHQMKEEHLNNNDSMASADNKMIIPFEADGAERFSQYYLGDDGTEEEIEGIREILSDCLKTLKKIPDKSRKAFVCFVEKAYKSEFGEYAADLYEVNSALDCSKAEFLAELRILNRYELVSEIDVVNETEEVCWIQGNRDFPTIWIDIREFCKEKGIELKEVIVDLDFSVFDG